MTGQARPVGRSAAERGPGAPHVSGISGASAGASESTGASGIGAHAPVAGIVCIVASALAFGAMAIFARIAYAAGIDTPTLLALRFTIAAVVLATLARLRGAPMPTGRDAALLTLMGGLGYAGQAWTFFTALTLAPAGLVALLLYLYPALVAVLATIFLRERLTFARIAALLIALAGMVLTVAPALAGAGQARPAGISLALAAAMIYAIYIVVGTRVSRRVSPWATASIVCAAAGAVFVVVVAWRGAHWPQTPSGWLAIGAIALVSTVAAITLFFAGLARIGATRASTLSTIEPLFTVLLAALVLHETIAPIQLMGGALILAAVWMLARPQRG
ncbi:MAG TPA: DMT family transporter [Casimicrobiaceae bacterium]|nr:DMT family transporter [Casimicrobiaceae bacterium]